MFGIETYSSTTTTGAFSVIITLDCYNKKYHLKLKGMEKYFDETYKFGTT